MYRHFIKRALDFTLSLLALIALSPVFGILALIIKLDSKGPVLFKQRRFGKDKRFFVIYKFRTMYVDTPPDMPTHMLAGADRHITRVGAFMRRTSLDELPQLINIVKGDMSIVGPRPALWNQDDLIAERDKYSANGVLPGLTGLAQILGRDRLPIPKKAKIDGQYVARMSFAFDAWCILKTAQGVFKGDDVVEGAADQPADTIDHIG